MRHGWCAVLVIAMSAPFAVAQTLDRPKFREAIELPAISAIVGVQFRSSERDGRGNKFEPLQKIAELQKKLTGGPEDAEIYLEQRSVYLESVKDQKKAEEMIVKADALVRPHLQTNDPKNAILLTTYGNLLETTNESPWTECEKLARRAVAVAPNDWRGWAYLAHVRHQQIPLILCGGDEKRLPKENRTQELLGRLYLRYFEAADVANAEKALNEALQYHDQARKLAPNEPKRQVQRYSFRLAEVVLRNAIAGYRDQKPPFPMQQIERVVLDELESAARLNPDHLLWQSQFVHHLVILGWQQKDGGEKDAPPIKKFRVARPEDEKCVREALARIEKLADGAQGEAAVFCHAMLAALCSSMQENATVEKHARKILQIDPKNQMAGEQLQQALIQQSRHADQLLAARELAQASPSARNDYLLAKALGYNQRFDLAEKACLDGLKKDANDVYCSLGLSALLMRRADDADTLKQVRTLLDRADRACRPENGALVYTELLYLTTVHQALSGDEALARVQLQRMHKDNADAARYGKHLSAFMR